LEGSGGIFSFSLQVQRIYEESKTYHGGKWMMSQPVDTSLFDDFIRLLGIKRRPKKSAVSQAGP